ncbi:MAG: tRNA preQ1(34) S-adenosylmethionine ribosyltransferase-isomerase QueA [Clostridiales bacterium]|nr:tRNA preQ1(34) S-adenosylmethionine ribosyltransferase-isomerase QueA [Clostridiales bacterium]
MKKSDFFYKLPEQLIAQHPTKKRDQSRMLVLDYETKKISHNIFHDIISYLKNGDCLVLNNTKVIPARLYGKRKDTGGKIEFVLLKKVMDDDWEVLVKPGKRALPGRVFVFGDGQLEAVVLSIVEGGNRIVRFSYKGIFQQVLDQVGIMPLPPYITEKLQDKDRYQTVYAIHNGSAAAPTAGLHFTKELLNEIQSLGVKVANVTLHVGLGTFRPVKTDNILDHKMHEEWYHIDKENADIINEAKKNGGRIISVGTTSARVLESVAKDNGKIEAKSGLTDIFIYPGYKFKLVDCLITNFHLPESTLLMLVSALAGKEEILAAYKEAIEKEYRFFSFGDAMFIKRNK